MDGKHTLYEFWSVSHVQGTVLDQDAGGKPLFGLVGLFSLFGWTKLTR
jgi:hypothetical protein